MSAAFPINSRGYTLGDDDYAGPALGPPAPPSTPATQQVASKQQSPPPGGLSGSIGAAAPGGTTGGLSTVSTPHSAAGAAGGSSSAAGGSSSAAGGSSSALAKSNPGAYKVAMTGSSTPLGKPKPPAAAKLNPAPEARLAQAVQHALLPQGRAQAVSANPLYVFTRDKHNRPMAFAVENGRVFPQNLTFAMIMAAHGASYAVALKTSKGVYLSADLKLAGFVRGDVAGAQEAARTAIPSAQVTIFFRGRNRYASLPGRLGLSTKGANEITAAFLGRLPMGMRRLMDKKGGAASLHLGMQDLDVAAVTVNGMAATPAQDAAVIAALQRTMPRWSQPNHGSGAIGAAKIVLGTATASEEVASLTGKEHIPHPLGGRPYKESLSALDSQVFGIDGNGVVPGTLGAGDMPGMLELESGFEAITGHKF